MSFVSKLFNQIAIEIGKPTESVAQYIQILEENWYDTEDVLRDLDDSVFEKLKIPARLVQIMKQKLKKQQTTETQQIIPEKLQPQIQQLQIQGEQQQQQPPYQQQNKQQLQQQSQKQDQNVNQKPNNKETIQEEQKQSSNNKIVQEQTQSFEEQLLYQLKLKTESKDQYLESIQTILRIFQNILNDPKKEQIRKLNIKGKVFSEQIAKYQPAIELLKYFKFNIDNEFCFLKEQDIDQKKLQSVCNLIQTLIFLSSSSEIEYDPYKACVIGTSGITNSQVARHHGFRNFYEELEELKKKRFQIMSQPIIDRDYKYYQLKIQNEQSQLQMMDQSNNEKPIDSMEEEIATTQDKGFIDYIKQMTQSLNEQTFSSQRKKEYERLIKCPCYSETRIRIKFPMNVFIESKFSPNEKVKDVIEFVQQHLENPKLPFYLYQTPPVQIMTQKFYNQTLDEMNCIPGALFYFGLDCPEQDKQKFFLRQDIVAKIMQNKE